MHKSVSKTISQLVKGTNVWYAVVDLNSALWKKLAFNT